MKQFMVTWRIKESYGLIFQDFVVAAGKVRVEGESVEEVRSWFGIVLAGSFPALAEAASRKFVIEIEEIKQDQGNPARKP